jgi:sugar/nucleoside kinase (ribokinase family)
MIDVIVSGHLCLDLIPQMSHLPLETLSNPGRLYETGALTLATGGAVSNTGLALHRLGVNVGLMAAIGDDLLGQMILKVVENRDPQLSKLIAINPGQSSSYTVVLSPYQTDRIFLHSAGANATFGLNSIDFALLKHEQAKIFHLGYPPILPRLYANDGAELVDIFRRAKATGVVTSLDMSLPDTQSASGSANWAEILRRTLPYVDIFVPSIEEILFMLRRADSDAWKGHVLDDLTRDYLCPLADEILAMGPKIVGFKLGEMGLYLKTNGVQLAPLELSWEAVELWSPAFEVDVVGTVGAGDSAYAGLLTSLLKGLPPQEAVRWACAVGACNVEAADATSGVRTWEATQTRLASGWQAKDIRLPGF